MKKSGLKTGALKGKLKSGKEAALLADELAGLPDEPSDANLVAPANTPVSKDAQTTTTEEDGGGKPRDNSTTDGSAPGGGRIIIKNLWEICCKEIEQEFSELDVILQKLGLPSVKYSKTKAFEITDYDYAPDIQQCMSKDFLDFYVFPYLLPAIQSLIQYARAHRVFQSRVCTFDALDFIVEYLHNNNPRYPDRLLKPATVFEIPFCKQWLEKNPRKPPPKWMLMSRDDAAIIIQRAIRGFVVRCRPDVQEMRQFWRDYKKDYEEESRMYGLYNPDLYKGGFPRTSASEEDDEEEFLGEDEDCHDLSCGPMLLSGGGYLDIGGPETPPVASHHSLDCVYCHAFRKFLDDQPVEVISSYKRASANAADAKDVVASHGGDGDDPDNDSGQDGDDGVDEKSKESKTSPDIEPIGTELKLGKGKGQKGAEKVDNTVKQKKKSKS